MLGSLVLATIVCTATENFCKHADLAVSVNPAQIELQSGARASVALTVENKGGDIVGGTVSLYHGGFFVSGRVVSASGGGLTCGSPAVGEPGVTCAFIGLAPRTSRTMNVEMAAPVSINSVSQAEIFAVVKPEFDTDDPVPGNNQALIAARVTPSSREADITIRPSSANGAFREDEPVVLSMDVTNRGPADVSRVAVQTQVLIASGSKLRSSDWPCSVSGSSIFCSSGALRAGESARLTITLEPTGEGIELRWTAKALADEVHRDPDFSNNLTRSSAATGSVENYERFLVPLIVARAPGAAGSLWQTELRAFSDSDDDVRLFPQRDLCQVGCSTPPAFGFPLLKRSMSYVQPEPGNGALLYTRREHSGTLRLNLVVRDLSRNEKSAGTHIPVVRESQLFTARLHLLNVPVNERFRHTLRVYDVDAREEAYVLVRVVDPATDQQLAEFTRRFDVAPFSPAGPLSAPSRPGYIEIGALTADVPLNVREVRVEVEPLTPGLRFWAFVSTTNNETQAVTLSVP